MSHHTGTVRWTRELTEPFLDNRYSRAHVWKFDGGVEVPASASADNVPRGTARADAVDPEKAFVVSLSSCHMLWFLFFAARQGFVVDDYEDDAIGVLGKNSAGKIAMTKVTLRPRVRFSGAKIPDDAERAALHHEAHDACFIANSVLTEIAIEPRDDA
jgi:organic hydroperoxide reductase OsmC/OhrA